jgi:D-aminopeptidase
MSEAKLSVEITEGQIANAIAVAISEAFSPEKKERLIRDIVRAHLSTKKDSYSRQSLLEEQIGIQIRIMASDQMKAITESWRPEINAIVSKILNPAAKDQIFAQLQTALQKVVLVNFTVNACYDVED